jgi:PBSX family phage terminase large subunit
MAKPPAREVELRYRLRPYQTIPNIDSAVTIVSFAGRGVGKTWNGCRWLLTQALTYSNTTWLAVAQTWGDAYRILAEGEGGLRWHIEGDPEHPVETKRRPDISQVLEAGDWDKAFTKAPGRMELRFANGSVIRFASADKPRSLRGHNAHGALADEVAFWDAESWAMLRLCVRLPLPDRRPATIYAASTPNGENWFYAQFLDATHLPRPDVAFVGGAAGGTLPPSPPPSTFDNPHLDAAFVSSLRAMFEGTDLGRQELYGEIISLRGQVYKGLTPLAHSRNAVEDAGHDWPTPDTADEVIAGLDLGSENPSAFVVLARSGERWCVVHEAVAPCADPSAVAALIEGGVSTWKPRTIVTDTNYPQTSAWLRGKGYAISDAQKGPGSVLDGIRAVQQRIAADGFAIDTEACPTSWRELRNYRWATGPDGSPLTPERPVKRDDHTCDAMRYALASVVARRALLFS